MTLLYLIAATYRPAGMERVLAAKANWLAAHGYDVIVATTCFSSSHSSSAQSTRCQTKRKWKMTKMQME